MLMSSDPQDPRDPIESELLREDSSFADTVAQFVEGLQGQLASIEEAINAADFDSLQTSAHHLKGSGGGHGYPILSRQAAELEDRAKNRVLNDCIAAFEELRKLCERVVADPDQPNA
jgi:HPt (histidine-containing phosphotransfer) domain-containing protein